MTSPLQSVLGEWPHKLAISFDIYIKLSDCLHTLDTYTHLQLLLPSNLIQKYYKWHVLLENYFFTLIWKSTGELNVFVGKWKKSSLSCYLKISISSHSSVSLELHKRILNSSVANLFIAILNWLFWETFSHSVFTAHNTALPGICLHSWVNCD